MSERFKVTNGITGPAESVGTGTIMFKSREQPIRIECMGGCGKFQMIRPSKIDRSVQFYGCMKCEGCDRAKQYALANRADGVHMCSHMSGAGVGGFGGWSMRLSTPEDEAAFARARDLLGNRREPRP